MAAWWFFWGALSSLSQAIIGRRGILKVLESPWTKFPLTDCCSHFPLPQSPLPCQGLASKFTFPFLLLSCSAESLEAAGAAAQRWFMGLSWPTRACHSHSNVASLLSRQETRGKHWAPLWQCLPESCLCKVCQQQTSWGPRRGFPLQGLVLRLSWGNQPLSPVSLKCPWRLEDFSGFLHGVRRYSLPVCWIC